MAELLTHSGDDSNATQYFLPDDMATPTEQPQFDFMIFLGTVMGYAIVIFLLAAGMLLMVKGLLVLWGWCFA